MRSLTSGAQLALLRFRGFALPLTALAAFCLIAASALLERRVSPILAADRALLGAAFGLVLPLGCYLLLDRMCQGGALQRVLATRRRHGAHGRAAAAGTLGVVLLLGATLGAAAAVVAVTCARGPGDPRALGDAWQSAAIGAWGGVGYVGLFALGSLLGRHGRGRLAALAADWLLGSGTSVMAVPWPRGHLRNLLGTEPVAGMSQEAAFATLVGLAVVTVGLTLWRVRP